MGFVVFILIIAVVVLFLRVRNVQATVRDMQRRLQWVETQAVEATNAPAAPAPPLVDAPPAPTPPPAPALPAAPPEAAPSAARPAPAARSARPARAGSSGTGGVSAPAPVERAPSRFTAFLAEHALSLAGGAFVLIAAILFLTYAINAGWINETLRTVLAGVLAAALALAAVRVARGLEPSERIGRAFGSLHGVLAGVAAAVAAADIVVAARRYEILDTTVAFIALLAVGGLTLATAVRWRSQDLAGIGVLGMLAAPIFVDAPPSLGTLVLLATALVVCMATIALTDWPRLGILAVLLTGPQLATWADADYPAHDMAAVIAVALAWWLVISAAMIVPVLIDPRRARRTSVIGTTVAASFMAYAVFEVWMDADGSDSPRSVVAGVFALIHVALGLQLLARRRAELVGLAAAIISTGAAFASVAIFSSVGDSAQAASLVAEAVGVSALWWIARSRIAAATAIVLTVFAIGQVGDTMLDPELIWFNRPGWDTLFAPIAVLVGCVVAHRLTHLKPVTDLLSAPLEDDDDGGASFVRRVLTSAAWITIWYIGFVVILQLLTTTELRGESREGMFTIAAWTFGLGLALLDRASRTLRVEEFALAALAIALIAPSVLAEWFTETSAVVLILVAATVALALGAWRRTPHAAWSAAVGWLATLAALALLSGDGSPERVLGRGVRDALETLPVLGWLTALLVVAAYAAAQLGHGVAVRMNAARVAAVVAVYLISACVMRALTDPPGDVQQDAQVALSITWAILGLASLALSITGPAWMRQLASLRIGAYTLLGVSGLKVLLLDTSQLETPFRIAVFFVVGLLLLGGARLEQVLRSRVEPGE